MNIYEIREKTKNTSPYFFSANTLRFFGQTMQSFTVNKVGNRYKIEAPIIDTEGHNMGNTIRYFNPINNKLERE